MVNEGSVHVMKWDGTNRNWASLGHTIVGGNESGLGDKVALSGNGRVLATTQEYNEPGSGRIKVYDYDETTATWLLRRSPLFDD